MVTRKAKLAKPFRQLNGHDSPFDVSRFGSEAPSNGLFGLGAHRTKGVESLLNSFGLSLRPRYGGNENIENPFVESWVVYACLRALSQAVAGVDLKVWQSDDPDSDEVSVGHPLVKLLSRPNPDMSWAQFAAAGMIHRKLSGEDFWFLMNKKGEPLGSDAEVIVDDPRIDVPTMIVPVIGSAVDAKKDANGHPTAWTYQTANGSSPEFSLSSVVHFADYDPSDPTRGLGDVEVAIRQISIAFQQERYQEAVSRVGGPGAFLVFKHTLDPDLRRAYQASIDEELADKDTAGGFHILSGDMDIIPNPVTPKDMQGLELLKWSRDVVASILGVPLPIIGVLENATYRNMEEAWRQFWLGVVTYLSSVEDVINSQFMPRLKGGFDKLRVGFDISGIEALKEDDSDRYKLAVEIAQAGIGMSFNRAAEMLGLDFTPEPSGDLVLVQAGTRLVQAKDVEQGSEPERDDAEALTAGVGVDASLGGEAVQDTALNGAQITSLLEVLNSVAEGRLSDDGAIAVILTSFPTISEEEASRMVAGVQVSEPEDASDEDVEPEGPPAGPTPPTAAPSAAEEEEEELGTRAPVLKTPDELNTAKLRRALNEEERKKYFELFEKRVLEKGDKRLEEKISAWFSAYLDDQLRKLESFASKGKTYSVGKAGDEIDRLLLVSETKWKRALDRLTRPAVKGIFADAIKDVAGEMGVPQIRLTDPRILRAVSDQVDFLSSSMTKTYAKRVKTQILRSLAKAEPAARLADRIKQVLPDIKDELSGSFKNKDTWSRLIARTETNKAVSTARTEQYKDAGVKKHQWITSRDELVRESHRALDGQIRRIGKQFKRNLRQPLDPDAPAEEVVNCRCTTVPIIED